MGAIRKFYGLWARHAVRGAWGRVDALTGAVGGVALPIAERLWPNMTDNWTSLVWQAPLGAVGAVILYRLFAAPFRIWKMDQEAIAGKAGELAELEARRADEVGKLEEAISREALKRDRPQRLMVFRNEWSALQSACSLNNIDRMEWLTQADKVDAAIREFFRKVEDPISEEVAFARYLPEGASMNSPGRTQDMARRAYDRLKGLECLLRK